MESMERKNLKLTGTSMAAGGVYNIVKMTGEETINGDLDCIDLKTTGTCEIRGNVKAITAKLTGTADIQGNLEAEEFTIVGTVDIDKDALIKDFNIYGEVNVKGNASVENVRIFGFLEISGECNTETFIAKGPFKIGGLLNAGTIDIEMHSKCQVKEIGGERIYIKRGTDMLIKKIIHYFHSPRDYYQGQLVADSIEGDDIYLEHTVAQVVRGNNIEIGPGCDIGLIEYKNNLIQNESSNVGNAQKI